MTLTASPHTSYQDRAGQEVPGRRAGISLTAIRGTRPKDWLLRLGANEEAVHASVPYREFMPCPSLDPDSVGMLGACGEWTYVLEGELAATWFLAQFDNLAVVPNEEEELVCVTLNHHHAPGTLAYSAPGIHGVWMAEFGRGFLEDLSVAPPDASGMLASFDEALARAGAVYERLGPQRPWQDMCDTEWATAIYRAIGDHFDFTVNRGDVEEGLLPAVALPLP
ncbi:hypothetical protein AAHZ94_01010 [Streptomyces sp. HSW2009]|uniref:hypothetical protein n=1 Tax=Streptomyces sp. HSW2009 TaxID=3142890 RepID=UPI0032EBFC76